MIISSPLGNLGLRTTADKLSAVQFLAPSAMHSSSSDEKAPANIVAELESYFKNPQHQFKLDLHVEGTDFQKWVWAALQNIPSGQVLTYKELAQKLNTSPRAIGNACRNNPLPIVIPCHRIVSKQGLGGYSGEVGGRMLGIKEWLLRHEGHSIISDQAGFC